MGSRREPHFVHSSWKEVAVLGAGWRSGLVEGFPVWHERGPTAPVACGPQQLPLQGAATQAVRLLLAEETSSWVPP